MSDINDAERQKKQMSINFNFLLEKIDEIHTLLCSHQKHYLARTWQQRAEEAAKEARRIAVRRSGGTK